MNLKLKLAAIGLVCASLAGCGGGGDDSSSNHPSTPQSTAEGFWKGTLSNGSVSDTYQMAILENGDTWGVETSGNYLLNATFGHTTSSGTQLSGTAPFIIPAASGVTYTGSFAAKSNLNAKFSNGSTYTASYDSSYDQPLPSLSTVAGTYTGTAISKTYLWSSVLMTVSSSGTVTMPAAQGCGASGTLKPHASGKNVFDVTLTFQGSACALGNGTTVRGVANYNTANRVVWAMALNPAQSDGLFFSGSK